MDEFGLGFFLVRRCRVFSSLELFVNRLKNELHGKHAYLRHRAIGSSERMISMQTEMVIRTLFARRSRASSSSPLFLSPIRRDRERRKSVKTLI